MKPGRDPISASSRHLLAPSLKREDVTWALVLRYPLCSETWTWDAVSFPCPSRRTREVNLREADHVLPEILPADEDTLPPGPRPGPNAWGSAGLPLPPAAPPRLSPTHQFLASELLFLLPWPKRLRKLLAFKCIASLSSTFQSRAHQNDHVTFYPLLRRNGGGLVRVSILDCGDGRSTL